MPILLYVEQFKASHIYSHVAAQNLKLVVLRSIASFCIDTCFWHDLFDDSISFHDYLAPPRSS